MAENPKPPSSEISTPAPNHHPPRRPRPRVREVSSRFMSPMTSSSPSLSTSSVSGDSHFARSPSIANPNPNPRSAPSTPSESNRNHPLRRSNSVQRPRFADENRPCPPDTVNRCSVSPVRAAGIGKPKSAVKLFKEASRTDTPVPALGPTPTAARLSRNHRNWESLKLLQANGIGMSSASSVSSSDQPDDGDGDGDGGSSVDGDCESVKSEPCDNNKNTNSSKSGNVGDCLRVSTPMSRSMELPYSGLGHSTVRGVSDDRSGFMRSSSGSVKVVRSLNMLPPMPPSIGGSKLQGTTTIEARKGVKKGSGHQEDAHRLKLLQNHLLQWRFINAKAKASMITQKRESEKQLYSLGVKIMELQESVKRKRDEVEFLRRVKSLSTILDHQMPFLDDWSSLEAEYSSSLQELVQGLQNALSQLPLVGNIRADVGELEGALNGASKTLEMIISQVQSSMPKAEQVDGLISDLARVYGGEVAMIEECGDLLSKTHLSQIEECSLRGQLMQQLHRRIPAQTEKGKS